MSTASRTRDDHLLVVNLLVVEDDPIDIENLRRALARTDVPHHVVNATDGVHALAALRDGAVPATRRLVLLDIGMPRMNGLEFLRELRADPPLADTAVVVLTTSDAQEDRDEAFRLHVAGYLVKPIRFEQFVELVDTLMQYWTQSELP